MDDAAAQAIVAELAPEVPEAPPVEWEPVRTEVPVPDLAAFIPALETVEPPPRTREELLASIPAIPSVEPLAGDAPAPDAGFTAPSLEAGAAWQPPTRLREELASPPPTAAHAPAPASAEAPPAVTTTALVRLPTPPEEERRSSEVTRPISRPTQADGGRSGEGPSDATARRRNGETGRSASAPSDSNLPSIATIRERLPHHMERLLQVPTSEVAQNSYKSPFRESREELIHRLLDPSLSLEDTARLLGVCPTTVRRYTNKGLLHHYRTQGNQRRFRLSDVLTFLDEHGSTWLLQEDDAETENEE
jgi:excisionase family DNA binding protein